MMYFTLVTLSALTIFYDSTANACMQSKQNWNNLKTTFNINPFKGFHDQPRTVADAEFSGWTKVDGAVDCKDVNYGR